MNAFSLPFMYSRRTNKHDNLTSCNKTLFRILKQSNFSWIIVLYLYVLIIPGNAFLLSRLLSLTFQIIHISTANCVETDNLHGAFCLNTQDFFITFSTKYMFSKFVLHPGFSSRESSCEQTWFDRCYNFVKVLSSSKARYVLSWFVLPFVLIKSGRFQ